jgi:TolA-binding protein
VLRARRASQPPPAPHGELARNAFVGRAVAPPLALAAEGAEPPPDRTGDAERAAYACAHAAHFRGANAAVALGAWNQYLARFPRGPFAPEARYNRALCLLRLRRFPEAAEALRPFAEGAAGSYRRAEAEELLERLTR